MTLFIYVFVCREQFISDRPFESLEEVEKYADKAFGSVYLLFLEIINNSDGHLKHAATALGNQFYQTKIKFKILKYKNIYSKQSRHFFNITLSLVAYLFNYQKFCQNVNSKFILL